MPVTSALRRFFSASFRPGTSSLIPAVVAVSPEGDGFSAHLSVNGGPYRRLSGASLPAQGAQNRGLRKAHRILQGLTLLQGAIRGIAIFLPLVAVSAALGGHDAASDIREGSDLAWLIGILSLIFAVRHSYIATMGTPIMVYLLDENGDVVPRRSGEAGSETSCHLFV